MQVTVALKNPPSGGTMWSISLIDWDVTAIIDFVGYNGKERLDIDEVAVFEIPSGWNFPLRVVLSVKRWKDGIVGGTIQYLYYVQSYRPYLWDFDIGDWSDEPDPTYREIFIPALGSYYYNVATEQFELIEPPEVVPCEITITAPNSAAEGETVNASVKIKNVSPYHYSYKATIYAVPDRYPDYVIGSIDQIITSGSSVTRNVSFTMPDCNVTVFIWLERWSFDHWVYDNSASKVVSLEIPVPEFSGTITRKQLEYDESRASIPAYDVPQNQRGLVHIWGRNDMATSQKLGIHWIVKDPDGLIVEDYQDWQFGSASPGATHEFIGGRFDINKAGTWTIAISLSMNPASPLTVDSYSGVLCVVAVLEYKGTITRKELEYDESRKAIPVY